MKTFPCTIIPCIFLLKYRENNTEEYNMAALKALAANMDRLNIKGLGY
jgi:hypothetical protein